MSTEEKRRKRPSSGIANANPWTYFTFAHNVSIAQVSEAFCVALRVPMYSFTPPNIHSSLKGRHGGLTEDDLQELRKVLYRVHGRYYFFGTLVGLAESIVKIAEAVFLGSSNLFSRKLGLSLALGLSIVGTIHATLHHHTFWPSIRTGMRIRTGLIAVSNIRANEIAYVRRANALRATGHDELVHLFPKVGTKIDNKIAFRAIETISESRISAQCITQFLLLPELRHIDDDGSTSTSPFDPENILGLLDANFTCGKASLCMALLRELPLTQGTFKIKHPSSGIRLKIAYASQSPWIFAGTIRDIIIFGEQYDKKRFREVVRVCELERDLSLFANAENELISEKSVTLSGGQRARVSLARSIYTDADLYVMDDPLSAVDPSVGRSLFENCICRYLSGKPRVLVTHRQPPRP
ncbi:P-loop containing nucleoside triphosphate hydrolase protein [Endogone sp. FLAS-F59071]|nr:P-loop containing nucleoside triphosphate hydrolase protein [Endogone sp. FLAS-F59071]|eukprot:RUS19536.1 P-loop containing nucleoside triphosphate hydrolase protein [Endogone sp. FLAS-F59071]